MSHTGKRRVPSKRELRIYEILGIVQFKHLLLWIESIRHRKTGGRNENYHPARLTGSSLYAFCGHLQYNALLHILSILFIGVYWGILASARISNWFLTAAVGIILVLNIYCILLQRYTYLRIRSILVRLHRREEEKNKILIARLQEHLCRQPQEELAADLSFLSKLQQSAQTGFCCSITDGDIPALLRLARCTAVIGPVSGRMRPSEAVRTVFPQRIYGRTNLRVSKLQRFFRVDPRKNVLFGYCILTETAQVDKLFCSIFPTYSRDRMEQIITLLISACTSAAADSKG